MPKHWTGFAATLDEMRPRPFAGFTPVRTTRPECPDKVLVCGKLRYDFDGSNLFLLDGPAPPDGPEPSHRVDENNTPWLRTMRTDPVRTPLGWSKHIGRPVFWLTDRLVFPAEIVSWILWRHRRTRAVWRTADPKGGERITPATFWAGENTSEPPLACIMPFFPNTYPRWSELRHDTPGVEAVEVEVSKQ